MLLILENWLWLSNDWIDLTVILRSAPQIKAIVTHESAVFMSGTAGLHHPL
ncbi:hypothetical protein [Yersinia rohdei]|uniref:hypothetical protein n=1 Tax=Yersinia rohdei TaxID=29485 RepID=UPI0016439284|nr:hypothetical protein [Yersinia rohdei]